MNTCSHVACLVVAALCATTHATVTITPTTDADLPVDGTLVYCPTFLAVWDGLKATVGGDLKMADQLPAVDVLNETPFPTNAVPEDAYVALGGRMDAGVVEELRDRLRAKFGAAAPELPADLFRSQTEFVAYCHLQRTLPFPKKYMRSQRVPLKFMSLHGEAAVQFFGSTGGAAEHYAGQTEVIYWKDDSEFTLRLRSKRVGESIVLAKMARTDRLATAIERVREQLQAERKHYQTVKVRGKEQQLLSSLGQGDLLAIPVLNLSVATNFAQVCGRKLINPGFQHIWLEQAYQDVQFKMDESGAVVRSTAYGSAVFGGPERSSMPRRFVFDRPFLLSLWRERAETPYLAVWVGSTDVMLPFEASAQTGGGTTR